MSTAMFLDICHAVSAKNKYFERKVNTAGLSGFATAHKVTAALRMLAYGGPADRLDDYIRMGESTILECVDEFTRTAVELYGKSYLRPLNDEDITRLL